MKYKRTYHTNINYKKARIPILIPDKADHKRSYLTRYKATYTIMLNVSICQKYKVILNVYVLNSRVSKHVKQTLTKLKGEIDKFTIIARNSTVSHNN